jgi:hypothetical protein
MDTDPSTAATKLLGLRDPGLLRDVMTHLPEAQATQVRQAVMQQMRDKAMVSGRFDPQALDAALRQYGDENLGILLGPSFGDLQAVRRSLTAGAAPGAAQPELARIAGNAAPEKIVGALTQGRYKSLEDFDAVWQTAAPQTQDQVRSAMLNDVRARSLDQNTGTFSSERFMKAINDVPKDIWDRVLTPDQRAMLDDLITVFPRINKYARIAGNPSQTGQTLGGMAQLTGAGALAASTAFGNEDPQSFAQRALMLTTPLLAGKAMMSGPGQRLLTSPVRRPYTPATSPAALFKLLGIGADQGSER